MQTYGQHGPILLDETHARFRLWAPDARTVSLVLVGAATLPMQGTADGWYSIDAPCTAGSEYRFLIDDELEVPDPASRAQAGDVHGASVLLDSAAYPWRHNDWRGRPWHETVFYELHVGACGGYGAIEARLPELAALGITAIELMPIAEFPGDRNWGYDGVLLYAPEAAYGPPEALKHLIDSAHGHGLMVFLDVVYNHFGPDGNYLTHYAQRFFRHDQQTPWGDAIDFRRAEVRDFFIGSALMWLQEYRFDGLRLDAVHAIPDEGFLVQLSSRIRREIAPGRHVHLVLENEHNRASLLGEDFTAQWNDDGHNVLHTLLTGEDGGYYADYAEDATAKLARFLAEGFIYQGQRTGSGEMRGEPSGYLPPTAFVLFLQNHDQIGNRAFGERLIGLTDPQALKAAMTLLLLSPMIPLLFMGEEWGSRQPFLYFTSHHGELAKAVREGRRAEFAKFAEFADEGIPDPNALATFDTSRPDFDSAQAPGHAEWLALYRRLLTIRHAEIIPRLEGTRAIAAEVLGDAAVRARWRMGDGRVLRLALNLGNEAVALGESLPARLLFASRDLTDGDQAGRLPARTALMHLETAQ